MVLNKSNTTTKGSFDLELDSDADLLFVLTPHYDLYLPNYGVAFVAESLKDAGIRTAFADINIALANHYRNERVERYWGHKREWYWNTPQGFAETLSFFREELVAAAEQVVEHPAPIVGFSVNMFNIMATEWIAADVRRRAPHKTIIYGGYSCQFEHICRHFKEPDYICVGESEASAPALVQRILNGGDTGGVPGVMEIRAGRGRYQKGAREEDLDRLPWPRWGDFKLDQYNLLVRRPTLPVATSRGCSWGRCYFCSSWRAVPGFRQRSAAVTIEELRHLHDNLGIKSVSFVDLLLNGDNAELERLCEMLVSSGLQFDFPFVYFRADKRLTLERLQKLKAAGFHTLTFGIESGCDNVLKLMRKGHNVRVIEECFRRVKEAGLYVSLNFVMGFPGETEEDVQEVLRFLERNRDVIDVVELVSACGALSGSDLWDDREKMGMLFEVVPGVEQVTDWVTRDGKNDFAERARRVERVKQAARDQGILLGDTYCDRSLRQLVEKILETPEGIARLLLRSAPLGQFRSMLKTLASELSQDYTFDLLLQQSVFEAFADSPLLGKPFQVPDGPLGIEQVPPALLESLRQRRYEQVLVPLGPMPRKSYSHVLELVRFIEPAEVMLVTQDGSVEVL